MSTLADELLHDFEDSADEGNDDHDDALGLAADELQDMDVDEGDASKPGADNGDGVADDEDEEAVEDPAAAQARVEKMQLRDNNLMRMLQPVLEDINRFKDQQATDPASIVGSAVEDHPEYILMSQSNSLSTQIDTEIVLLHKFIRDHYSVRFPELELHLHNALDYAKVVQILGNGPLDSNSIDALRAPLRTVLDGPSLMIIILEATRTEGTEMSNEELQRVLRACQMVISLDEAKQVLTGFVQSRTKLFAPNLTTLINSVTAAQLLSAAGGLTGLSKTPACNIAAWGSKKQKNTALATNIGIRQQGFLYYSDIVRQVPEDLKRQAMRIVSAKVVLAARIDLKHESRDGSTGQEFRDACLDRLEKLRLPPPNQRQRALPAPDDKPSRKRGGRRARKAKEATAMTELRKAQNRMAFGKEEKEVGYGTGEGTVGLGMIGQANDGRIRNTQIDQRTRAKLSAKSKGWGGATSINGASSTIRAMSNSTIELGKGLRTTGVGSTIGTASSLAFTPMQGLELVDPKVQAEMSRKRKADEDRWFKGGAFTQVASTSTSSGNGGFKVPALPPNKRVDTGANKGKMDPPS